MELNTSQPHHSEIMTKPSRNPILYIVVGALLIAFTALGLLIWQKNQEIGQALGQLSDTEKRLTDSLNKNNDKTSTTDKQQAMYTLSENDQKEQALLGASAYYCGIVDFGCDKVTAKVTEFQKTTQSTAGYAKVVATNAANKTETLWLINRMGGSEWIVFYDDAAMPSSDIIKRFAIPADLLSVN